MYHRKQRMWRSDGIAVRSCLLYMSHFVRAVSRSRRHQSMSRATQARSIRETGHVRTRYCIIDNSARRPDSTMTAHQTQRQHHHDPASARAPCPHGRHDQEVTRPNISLAVPRTSFAFAEIAARVSHVRTVLRRPTSHLPCAPQYFPSLSAHVPRSRRFTLARSSALAAPTARTVPP